MQQILWLLLINKFSHFFPDIITKLTNAHKCIQVSYVYYKHSQTHTFLGHFIDSLSLSLSLYLFCSQHFIQRSV